MADDLEFNIKFVKLIEHYKVLYDHSTEGNSNRVTQEKAWREIANEMGENWMTCKEKWKNIRSCYARHLRQIAGDKTKKPYYLSKHLQFLLPFCRTLVSANHALPFSSPSQALLWSKIETTDNEPEEDPLTLDNRDECSEDNAYFIAPTENEKVAEEEILKADKKEETSTEISGPQPRKWKNRRRKLMYLNDHPVKRCLVETEDPDLNFFKSLLPDVRRMTNKQKNRLKIRILNEIDAILYTDLEH